MMVGLGHPSSLKRPRCLPIVGSNSRIAIVHARWNRTIISALVAGARKALLSSGVKEENIVVQDVPGSYELPFAVQRSQILLFAIVASLKKVLRRIYNASQLQASHAPTTATSVMTDLLSSASLADLSTPESTEGSQQEALNLRPNGPLQTPFNAIIAIGVLIKGETMHFEYIANATSHGLMKVQLELGVPIVFGLLTVLNEEQGKARAGLVDGKHCHGEDWGHAAVELACKRAAWSEGKYH